MSALYYYSRALRVVLLVVAEVRCHVEQEQSRALGSRAGGGCWADCPAVWARGAASTHPDLSSGPACLQGLLAPLERKNGWHLAEAAGDCSPPATVPLTAGRSSSHAFTGTRMHSAMTCGPMGSSS